MIRFNILTSPYKNQLLYLFLRVAVIGSLYWIIPVRIIHISMYEILSCDWCQAKSDQDKICSVFIGSTVDSQYQIFLRSMDTHGKSSAFFWHRGQILRLPICSPAHLTPSEKGSNLKGKNLLASHPFYSKGKIFTLHPFWKGGLV